MDRKIAFISSSFYGQRTGGAEYQQFLLATHLKRLQNKIYYIFSDYGDPIKHRSEFELFRLKRKNSLSRLFGPCFFLDYFQLINYLNRIVPDIIFMRGSHAYTGIAAKYCAKNGCKMIWQIAGERDIRSFEYKFKRSLLFEYIDRKFLEYGIRKANLIIGQAIYQEDLLFEKYKKRCDLIVPNYHPLPVDKIDKKMPIKIVWVANFKALKRPELFIKLASKFRGHQDLKFIMIGRSSNSRRHKSIMQEISQVENIDYRGELTLNEVNQILSESHVFVNTSSFEGFPNTYIQAWMRKVPVVTLDVDPDDIIKKHKIGLHSRNFAQMAKDVHMLVTNSELREQMGERAQLLAFQKFSLENIKKIVELIEA